MNLYFCDLCNESIPQSDLDLGKAVRRNERLICAACEGAMSGGHVRPLTDVPAPEIAPPPPARPAPAAASSSLAAVGLAFSVVALLLAMGGGAYLFLRLEERAGGTREELAKVVQTTGEQSRAVSSALVTEKGAREAEFERLNRELQRLKEGVDQLTRRSEASSALEPRIERLDERLSSLDDLASRVAGQDRTLLELSATVARLAAEQERVPEPKPEPKAQDAPAAPAAAKGAPAGVPAWQNWVVDLASPNSGTRWQAVQSLGGTGDVAVVPHLVPMLDDVDIFVRMAAARLLGDLGSVDAIPALIDTLEDDEAAVREAAIASLQGLVAQHGFSQGIAFDPLARDGDRSKRVKAWREWWEQASKDLGSGKAKSKG